MLLSVNATAINWKKGFFHHNFIGCITAAKEGPVLSITAMEATTFNYINAFCPASQRNMALKSAGRFPYQYEFQSAKINIKIQLT